MGRHRRTKNGGSSTAHIRVLGPRRARLWREVREARDRHQGYRDAAIAEVAQRNGISAAELNHDIAAMKFELTAAGVTQRHRFYVSTTRSGELHATNAVDGSAHHRELVAAGAPEFESLRYAYNAATVMRAVAALDGAGRAQLAGLIDTAVADPDTRHIAATAGGVELAAGTYRDVALIRVGGDRVWTGTVNHARWIRGAVATGVIDTVNGPLTVADPVTAPA